MRKQAMFGWLATLALLLSLSVAACQPITAPVAQAAAPGAADDATEEVNKAAVRGWFDAINSQDVDTVVRAVDQYYALDYVLHDPTVPHFSGGAATIKQLVRESMQTLPDGHLTIEDLIAEGDKVAIRVRVTGTQPDGTPLAFFSRVWCALSMVSGPRNGNWRNQPAQRSWAQISVPNSAVV
jgi:ketosteroid isomerase-like protein